MKLRVMKYATVFVLGSLTSLVRAQDFSADVVYSHRLRSESNIQGMSGQAHASSRVFVSHDKMRLETRGLTDLILLVEGGNSTTVALYPALNAYRQMGSRPSQYFRVTDPENACPDWQRTVREPLNCEKMGDELVDGRKAIKYRNSKPGGGVDYVWIDSKLNYVVKWEMGETGAELHNIQEGPQSADLFVIPQGYDTLKPPKKPSRSFGRPPK